MKIYQLTEQFSVSEQITADDVPALAEAGVQMIVCNRPDREAADQPDFQQIREAAERLDLEALNIPFTGGQMTEKEVQQLAEVLDTGKRIHAYCRTGNRSQKLWEAAQSRPAPQRDSHSTQSPAKPQ